MPADGLTPKGARLTVPADGLTPKGAGPSAGTILITQLNIFS